MTGTPNDPYQKYLIPDRLHRRQSMWQIWLPIFIILLLLAGLFTATLVASESGSLDLGLVQNTAIMLLILPMALIGLINLIALLVTIAITSRIFTIMPRLRLLSMQVDSIAVTITTWSNRLLLPFVVAGRLRDRLSPKKRKLIQD